MANRRKEPKGIDDAVVTDGMMLRASGEALLQWSRVADRLAKALEENTKPSWRTDKCRTALAAYYRLKGAR